MKWIDEGLAREEAREQHENLIGIFAPGSLQTLLEAMMACLNHFSRKTRKEIHIGSDEIIIVDGPNNVRRLPLPKLSPDQLSIDAGKLNFTLEADEASAFLMHDGKPTEANEAARMILEPFFFPAKH